MNRGARKNRNKEVSIICPNCKAILHETTVKCYYCGTNL